MKKKHIYLYSFVIFFCLILASAGYYSIIYLHVVRSISAPVSSYSKVTYLPGYTEGPNISAPSAILIDLKTGTVLYAKNEHVRRPPASTTKIMTAIVAIELGDLEDIVTVSKKAAYTGGSSVWLKVGDRIKLDELLRGTMIKSGNDGCVAIAEHISGTEGAFVELMNHRAAQLGAHNTQFRNPHGLPAAGHYSSAFDLAIIASYAIRYPKIADIVSTKTTIMDGEEGTRDREFWNTNKLLWSFEGSDGVKTGTTSEAGQCLVASATRDGRQMLSVVLRSSNRWAESEKLLKYGFEEFELLDIYDSGEVVTLIDVKYGLSDQVSVLAEAPLSVIIPRGMEEEVVKEIIIDRSINAPVRKNEKIGEVKVSLGDSELGAVNLVFGITIPRKNIVWVFIDNVRNVFTGRE